MFGASYLLEGQVMAIGYSGFRAGQHPDSANAKPTDEQILEDLGILIDKGFTLIRVYGSSGHGADTVRVIAEHDLPVKVLLGIWLDAEISNHENNEWLTEPIPQEKLDRNKKLNAEEVARGIELAKRYSDVVVAINVGNEALVDWNDHMVTLDSMIDYVDIVKAAVEQPVTVADNYLWWVKDGKPLAERLDFIGVHTYALWENKSIDEGMAFTIENLEQVRDALPGKPIAVLEAGWATHASEFPEQANTANQVRYYDELKAWAEANQMTIFFFEAFDEPWKGDPNNPDGVEKHWGIFYEDRTPKPVMQR